MYSITCISFAGPFNQVQEIGLAVQGFKFLAEEMEIPIILIAQPRKIEADAVMTAQDLKDSSSIYSDCDHLIIMHRRRLATDGKNSTGPRRLPRLSIP